MVRGRQTLKRKVYGKYKDLSQSTKYKRLCRSLPEQIHRNTTPLQRVLNFEVNKMKSTARHEATQKKQFPVNVN